MARFRRKILLLGAFHRERGELYQQMHIREFREWSRLSGHPIRITIAGAKHWNVEDLSAQVETNVEVLAWDALLPALRGKPIARLGQMIRATIGFLRNRDNMVFAGLPRRPLAMLIAVPLLLAVLPLIIGIALFAILSWIAPIWLTVPLAVGCAALAGMRIAVDIGQAPMNFLIFADRLARNEIAAYHHYVDDMAARLEHSLSEGWDEVLLVAHSHGTLFSMPILRRLLRRRYGLMPANFSLLTLGNCIPLLACRSDAHDYRYDLAEAMDGRFRWVDIGSPRDWTSFFGVGAERMSRGVPTKVGYEPLSARLHLYLDRRQLRRSLADIYRFPFNYMKTGRRISLISFPALSVSDRRLETVVDDFRIAPALPE